MATCYDCIHLCVCYQIEHYGRDLETKEPCKFFISVAKATESYPVELGAGVFEFRVRNKRYGRRHDAQIASKYHLYGVLGCDTDEIYIAEKEFRKSDKARWNKTVFPTYEEAEKKLKSLRGVK